MNTENINYSYYTRLPVKTLMKADKANPVLEVLTPQRGSVFLEIKSIDKGLFRRATEVDRNTNEVVNELIQLEVEARTYLLDKWLRHDQTK